MNSNAENSALVQVLTSLKKSEEFCISKIQKSYTSRKEEKVLPFYNIFVYTKLVRAKK